MYCMHFCHTTNLKKIPDHLLALVHSQTRDICIHIPIDRPLQVAFPEVKGAFQLVEGGWVLVREIFLSVFFNIPVPILVERIKQDSKLSVHPFYLALVIQCSLEQNENTFKIKTISPYSCLTFTVKLSTSHYSSLHIVVRKNPHSTDKFSMHIFYWLFSFVLCTHYIFSVPFLYYHHVAISLSLTKCFFFL